MVGIIVIHYYVASVEIMLYLFHPYICCGPSLEFCLISVSYSVNVSVAGVQSSFGLFGVGPTRYVTDGCVAES